MTLLGTPLLVTLGFACVGFPVLCILLWSRCRGGHAARSAQRLAMIIACQLAALLFVGAVVNDNVYFFASWTELVAAARQQFVSGSPAFRVVHRSVPVAFDPASAGSVTRLHDYPFAVRSTWPRRGRVMSVVIDGAASGLRSHAYLYLPPQYFQPRYRHVRFPAVEVMTGYPGVDLNLVNRMDYPGTLLGLIARHKAQPLVLVMLRPSVTYPRDTECTDVPAGPQAFTYFAADVPAEVSYDYRVRPTGWGAIGDSTGGYCAAKLAMMAPAVFSAGAALSGYFFALHDHTTQDLWAGSRVLQESNDLDWRLAHLPAPPVSILVASSPAERGTDGWAEAQRFIHATKPPLRVATLVVPHGGHNLETWDAELPAALTWLAAQLPAAGNGVLGNGR